MHAECLHVRLQMPERKGKFGNGAYCDEPWSMVAIRKRVTSFRKFYEYHLEGNKMEVNPGWQPIVKGTVSSIALLLGDGVHHVRSMSMLLCVLHAGMTHDGQC